MTVNVRRKRRYTILSRQTAPSGRRAVGVVVKRDGLSLYTLLSIVTLAGVLAGAFCGSGLRGPLASEVMTHGAGVIDKGFSGVFLDSLAILAVYTGLCFFGGLSSAGAPLGYILCFFKGLAAGTLCACIFSGGTANAPLGAAADILPFEAMSIALLIFSARENIRMSEITRKRTFLGFSEKDGARGNGARGNGARGNGARGNGARGGADLGLYLKKFAVISLAAVAAAAVDGGIGVLINL